MSRPVPDHDAVIADTAHWMEKAVIGLNLCPFAKAVQVKKQIRYVVSDASTPEELLEQLVAELEVLADADPEKIDTTLLIHPHVLTDFFDFNEFLDVADAALEELGWMANCRLPVSIRITSLPIPTETISTTTPTARLIRPCTCCAKTASTAPWKPSPRRPIFSKRISPPARARHDGWDKLMER
jgi:hypothetical protein